MMIKERRAKSFQKVFDYLQNEFNLAERKEIFRLPSIRDLSEQTGVSPTTARNVLIKMADSGHVEVRPGSGTFWLPEPGRKRKELVVGVNSYVEPHSHQNNAFREWLYQFYGGIVRGALKENIEIKFKPFMVDLSSPEELSFTNFEAAIKGIDCVLLSLPSQQTLPITEFLRKLAIPCIYFNPLSPTETGNFICPDYYNTAQKIGSVWAKTGRRRIMMLQAPGTRHSTSCQLLLSGLMSGLGNELEIFPEIYKINVPLNLREPAAEAFSRFVKSEGKAPDAVYCTADDVARGVQDAAGQLGIDVPSEMSIIGGNGISHSEPFCGLPPLTATRQPLEKIGEAFVEIYQRHLAQGSRDVPGIYVPMRILIGETTRSEENELLLKIF